MHGTFDSVDEILKKFPGRLGIHLDEQLPGDSLPEEAEYGWLLWHWLKSQLLFGGENTSFGPRTSLHLTEYIAQHIMRLLRDGTPCATAEDFRRLQASIDWELLELYNDFNMIERVPNDDVIAALPL